MQLCIRHMLVRYDALPWFQASQVCAHDRKRFGKAGWGRLNIGMYVAFIEKWLEHFDKGQFLVVKLEDYDEDPRAYLEKVFRFLGLPEMGVADWDKVVEQEKVNVHRDGAREEMLPETRALLEDFYRPYNTLLQQVVDATGMDLGRVFEAEAAAGGGDVVGTGSRGAGRQFLDRLLNAGRASSTLGDRFLFGYNATSDADLRSLLRSEGSGGGSGAVGSSSSSGSEGGDRLGGGDGSGLSGVASASYSSLGLDDGNAHGGHVDADSSLKFEHPDVGSPNGGAGEGEESVGKQGLRGGVPLPPKAALTNPQGFSIEELPWPYEETNRVGPDTDTSAVPFNLMLHKKCGKNGQETLDKGSIPKSAAGMLLSAVRLHPPPPPSHVPLTHPSPSNYSPPGEMLSVAAFAMDIAAIKTLVWDLGVHPDSPIQQGMHTPLMAVGQSFMLRDAHAKSHVFNMIAGHTSWLDAYIQGNTDVIWSKDPAKKLLPSTKDDASAIGHKSVVARAITAPLVKYRLLVIQWLVAAGADVRLRDYFGNSAMHYEAYSGHRKLMGAMLSAITSDPLPGAEHDVSKKVRDPVLIAEEIAKPNNDGRTPLHLAASSGHFEILEEILDAVDTDVDAKARHSLLQLPDQGGTTVWDIVASPGLFSAEECMTLLGVTQRPLRTIGRVAHPELHTSDANTTLPGIGGENGSGAFAYGPGWVFGDGGWATSRLTGTEEEFKCDVDQYWAHEITGEQLYHQYLAPGKPVLIRGLLEHWPATEAYRREVLLRDHGTLGVTVSSIPYAEKFKGDGQIELSLAEYMEEMKEHRMEGGAHPWYVLPSCLGV